MHREAEYSYFGVPIYCTVPWFLYNISDFTYICVQLITFTAYSTDIIMLHNMHHPILLICSFLVIYNMSYFG